MNQTFGILATVLAICTSSTCLADSIEIKNVQADRRGESWNFSVTLLHPDSGWDHYADGWELLDQNGERIGYRELLHPHENEQPFTRSLSGVVIPDGTDTITVRAHCSVDGWVGEPFELALKE